MVAKTGLTVVTFNDKDPPWMSEYLKNKTKWHSKICAEYLYETESVDYIKLQNVIATVSELVWKSKDDYNKQLARKLSKPKTSSITYWPILKTFYNGKKVPLIPPLITHNTLEPDFKRKADHIHNFFASKCTPLKRLQINIFPLPRTMNRKINPPVKLNFQQS